MSYKLNSMAQALSNVNSSKPEHVSIGHLNNLAPTSATSLDICGRVPGRVHANRVLPAPGGPIIIPFTESIVFCFFYLTLLVFSWNCNHCKIFTK
jgi:hypothetical protein